MLSKTVYYKDTALFLFLFTLFLVGNHTGSLILAGAGALGGLVGILGHKVPSPSKWPLPIWTLLIFCVYVYTAQFWSPYETKGLWNNPFRFLIGVPLYGLFILALHSQNERQKQLWRYMLGGGLGLSAAVMLTDYASGFGITQIVEKDIIIGFIDKNLQHGLTVLIISMPPLLLTIVGGLKPDAATKSRFGLAFAALIYLCVLGASLMSGTTACILSILAGSLFALLANRYPNKALTLAFACLAALILFAPVISVAAHQVTPDIQNGLPFSWQHRVETWRFLYDKIIDAPVFGQGFDALRTYTDTITLGERDDISIVSMHAHNLGLHIWVETGLVGAILASAFIGLSARHILKAPWLTKARALSLSAALASITVIAALSYSAWQDWWLAAIAIALSFNVLLPSANPRANETD